MKQRQENDTDLAQIMLIVWFFILVLILGLPHITYFLHIFNSKNMINENSQQSNSASSALKSRLCYVIQVVAFIVAILGLVLFLTIDYVGNTGNNNI